MKTLILIALLSTQVLALGNYNQEPQAKQARKQAQTIVYSNITPLLAHHVRAKQVKETKRTLTALVQALNSVKKAVK